MSMRREIDFYGVPRSGNHAIIFWCLNNLGGVTPPKDLSKNVFSNNDKQIYYYNHVDRPDFDNGLNNTEYTYRVRNFENTHYTVKDNNYLILRDIVNVLCSQFMYLTLKPRDCMWKLNETIENWKKDAQTQNIDTTHTILYNKWVLDEDYRNTVAKNLNIPNEIDNTKYVSFCGEGSSFIKMNREEDLNNYNERFKDVILPFDICTQIRNDKLLQKLNEDIFNLDITQLIVPGV